MKAPVLALTLLMPVPAAAQSAAPPTAAAAPALAIPLGTRVGESPSGYEDGGRRDPFTSLVTPKRTGTAAADGRPRSGLAALALADVTVKGVVRSGATMLAILEAPGRQSFVTRVKDRLLDATVKSIDSGGVVFAEQAGPSTTDVRKALRPTGDEVR